MIKRIAVFLISVLSGTICSSLAQPQIGTGFLAGANFANMEWDWLDKALEAHGSDLTIRSSLCFGAVIEIYSGKQLAFKLEPMYIAKGTNFKGYYGHGEFWVKSSYIEVPALLKYAIINSPIQPYVIFGPCIGFLLSAETNDSDIGYSTDMMKNIEISASIGVGIRLSAGPNSLFLESRYTSGNNLMEKVNADINNKGVQLLVGITFSKQKPALLK